MFVEVADGIQKRFLDRKHISPHDGGRVELWVVGGGGRGGGLEVRGVQGPGEQGGEAVVGAKKTILCTDTRQPYSSTQTQ